MIDSHTTYVITGDEGHLSHHFPRGTEVRLTEMSRQDDHTCLCEPLELYVHGNWIKGQFKPKSGRLSEDSWWVHEMDLEPLLPEPTDQEVLELFGVIPTPHCTTCTCHSKD